MFAVQFAKGPLKEYTITFMRVTKVVEPADGHKKDVDSIEIRMRGYETHGLVHSNFLFITVLIIL